MSRLEDNNVYNAILQMPKAVIEVAKGLNRIAEALNRIADSQEKKREVDDV